MGRWAELAQPKQFVKKKKDSKSLKQSISQNQYAKHNVIKIFLFFFFITQATFPEGGILEVFIALCEKGQ